VVFVPREQTKKGGRVFQPASARLRADRNGRPPFMRAARLSLCFRASNLTA
jgi:hypothetical protein